MRILDPQIAAVQIDMIVVSIIDPVVDENMRVSRTERVAWPDGKLNLSTGALRGGASPGTGRVRLVNAFINPTMIMS